MTCPSRAACLAPLVLFAALFSPPARAQPAPAVFVKMSTGQVASGTTPTTAGTTSIAAPGAGWTWSAAAPVAGTTWNVIQRPNPSIGSNSTSTIGEYVCNSANGIALASATGGATPVTLSVYLNILDLEGNTTRTEPNSSAGGNTALGPAALMSQCWRIYRGGNGTIHRFAGLPAGAHYYLYFYGTTTTTGQGCKFTLDAANVPGGDGTATTFVELRGGNSGNIYATDGTTYSLTTPAVANVVSSASDNNSWGRLHAIVDGSGNLVFRTGKNAANGQYINGYQLMPFPLPVITTQPPPGPSVTVGSDISLSATVVGEGVITYQWRKDTASITDNPSATTSQLDLTNVQAGAAGVYDLVITNEGGSVTSDPATLSVTTDVLAPSVQTEPADLTASVGGNVAFTVLANGTSPLSYVWEKSLDGTNFTVVAGEDDASLAFASVQTGDAGHYRVTIANSAGSDTSRIATLIVAPVIVAAPSAGQVASGALHTLTVTADAGAGSPAPLVYVWKKAGVPVGDTANISGSATASLQFAAFGLADSGLYTVTVSNPAGAVTTGAVYVGTPTTLATTRFPAAGATTVNRDTTLRLTFTGGTPVVGSTGRIRLFRASDDSLVETLDLASAVTLSQKSVTDAANVTYRYLGKTIGANTYKYLPVTVAGDTATITFSSPSLLAYGQAYYVKTDAGVLLDSSGATYPEINDSTTWRFTVKPSGPAADATALSVAADGSGDFTTVQGAIDHVPTGNSRRVTISVAPGYYEEYVVVKTRPLVTLRGTGANAAATRIAYLVNNNVYNLSPASSHLGARAVFTLDAAPDFVADNLTIQNLTAKGGSQAEAMTSRSGSLRSFFNNVRVLSLQDTLLPEHLYMKDSYIEGDVDFMWGGGVNYYDNCEIKAMNGGYYAQFRTPNAASYGGVFVDCRFTAAPGLAASTQVFNRINPGDYPHAQMVLIDCAVGPHLKSNPWQLDGGATAAPTIRLWEYHSTDLSGAPLDVSGRPTFNAIATGVGGSTVLPKQQIDQATADFYRVPANILGGWTPTLPVFATPYETFAAAHGLDPATDGAPTADPDADGLPNALEFALAGDPLAADVAAVLPTLESGGAGVMVLSYDLVAAAGDWFEIWVETSPDLVVWTPREHGVGGVSVVVTPLDVERDHVEVTLPVSGPRLFARLRATTPE